MPPRTIHNGGRDRQRAIANLPSRTPWRANFFTWLQLAGVTWCHQSMNMARTVLKPRYDESCILTILDSNDGTGGSQEHAEAAEYCEIAYETSTYRYHPEAECV
jgi:hypothetical protein